MPLSDFTTIFCRHFGLILASSILSQINLDLGDKLHHQQNLIFVAEKPEKPVLWDTMGHYVVLHSIP